MKFRRHDLEKRSGGSPVIVFHHRRPVCSSSPHPRFPPLATRLLLRCTSGVEPTREHQFFSAPSDVCLFSSPSSPPPPFSRSFASVGFPRSWLCHLVPDGRSFPHSPLPPSTPRSVARIFDHGAFRVFGSGTRREHGYPSFLRAHHLSPGADREVITS